MGGTNLACQFVDGKLSMVLACPAGCPGTVLVFIEGLLNTFGVHLLTNKTGVGVWAKVADGFAQQSALTNVAPESSVGTIQLQASSLSSTRFGSKTTLTLKMTTESRMLSTSRTEIKSQYIEPSNCSVNGQPLTCTLQGSTIKFDNQFCPGECAPGTVFTLQINGRVALGATPGLEVTTIDKGEQVIDYMAQTLD